MPDPAPARMSSGPLVVVTARACSGFRRATISAAMRLRVGLRGVDACGLGRRVRRLGRCSRTTRRRAPRRRRARGCRALAAPSLAPVAARLVDGCLDVRHGSGTGAVRSQSKPSAGALDSSLDASADAMLTPRDSSGRTLPGLSWRPYVKALMARAKTMPMRANEMSAWVPMASFVHETMGMVSVGLKAFAVVKATYR